MHKWAEAHMAQANAAIRVERSKADVITSSAHKVTASLEILLGKADLSKSATAFVTICQYRRV